MAIVLCRLFLHQLWNEGRRTFHWVWVFPICLVLLSLVLSHSHPPTMNNGTTGSHEQNSAEVIATPNKPVRTSLKPDYASNMRNDLEMYLPLIFPFLVIAPLAREWQVGTIAALATRRSLARLFLIRFFLVALYTLIVVVIAAIGTLLITEQPPESGAIGLWCRDTIWTVGPTILFSGALGLLIAVTTVSELAGYVTVVSIWAINFFFTKQFSQLKPVSDLVLYTLNGWQYHESVVHQDQWWIGKAIWLGASLICLAAVIQSLGSESRFIRNNAE